MKSSLTNDNDKNDLFCPASSDDDKKNEETPSPPPAAAAATTIAVSSSSSADNPKDDQEHHLHITITKHALVPHPPETILQRQASAMGQYPCWFLLTALLLVLTISALGLVLGEFSVSADNAGWQTRGTTIANRHTQFLLIDLNKEALFLEDTADQVWEDLITNIQPGWETDDDDNRRRRLDTTVDKNPLLQAKHHQKTLLSVSARVTTQLQRELANATTTNSVLDSCDLQWYTTEMLEESRLWPIWRPTTTTTTTTTTTILSSRALQDLCLSEQQTQLILEQQDLCHKCGDAASSSCLPPYSLVLFARLTIPSGLTMSCEELATAWENDYNTAEFQQELMDCAAEMEAVDWKDVLETTPASCPDYFTPFLIDEWFSTTGQVQYTSSIFATKANAVDEMYDIVDSFPRGTAAIEGVYDTQNEDFVNNIVDASLGRDMTLALGSAVVTFCAIIIHTRSPFLSVIGLLQIVLSFPVAFAFYTFVGQLEFFPFLNFIGVFVVFALGADDIFVAVDKWKNARIELVQEASTSDVAVKALPDATGAMFLTTLTTAIAFFGTAICPVAPIRMFAIFCGLLIVFDYVLCVLLVFPALCIYDSWRHKKNCCCHCHFCHRLESEEEDDDDNDVVGSADNVEEGQPKKHSSLIHRILSAFYIGLHKFRYPLCVACLVALILSIIFAAKMALPTSSDVRLLKSSVQFERNYEWRQNLLYSVMSKKGGSWGFVMWGTTPADTGDQGNPDSFSQLVLDDSFEPSEPEAQVYLRDFCGRFFENDWANPLPDADAYSTCAINRFEAWLQEQAISDSPDPIYEAHCGGAFGLPMSENNFDACIFNWGQMVGEWSILARNGKVEVIYFAFNSRVRYDSPYDDLDKEWHTIEKWMKNENAFAPETANKMFFTSDDFWWYDTNGNMLSTAYVAAAIAIGAAAAVILFSSRSVVLTVFSAFTIGYVLASVTASLVAVGWTLGFLESVCFAILIGISCDFVIHFTHAYSTPTGEVSRHDRTKFALIKMGPSILAAAFTTIAAATIMLFTVVTFFVKFAVILFLTILQATVGSFIVFLVLADSFGPSRPTMLYDRLAKQFCGGKNEDSRLAGGSQQEGINSPASKQSDGVISQATC